MVEQCYMKLKLTDDPLVKTIEQYLYIILVFQKYVLLF